MGPLPPKSCVNPFYGMPFFHKVPKDSPALRGGSAPTLSIFGLLWPAPDSERQRSRDLLGQASIGEALGPLRADVGPGIKGVQSLPVFPAKQRSRLVVRD